MTPATISALKPRMTQMSWAEVRQSLQEHQDAITILYGNCEALKSAIDGEIVDGKLVCPTVQSYFALREASFLGRLRWLLAGKL